MVLSSSERDDLVLRVERALARAPGSVRPRRSMVRAAVDATLGALPEPPAGSPASADRWVAIVASPSAPDLASRVHRALEASGVRPLAMASAREGRHCVVTIEVHESDRKAVREVARRLGASCAWRGGMS